MEQDFVNNTYDRIDFKENPLAKGDYDNCSELGLSFSFDNCNLDHSSFYKTKIKKTFFKNSQLREVDFTDCDLANSSFENCNLAKARFENTILEKVDFRTSHNYSMTQKSTG